MKPLHYSAPEIAFVEPEFNFQICQESLGAGFEEIGEENWV